jgi:putative two-component system response regulator
MAGIDGYETLHRLKEKEWTKSIPVIIISALDDEEEKNRLIQGGAAAFVAKPLQYNDLIKTIQKSIGLD